MHRSILLLATLLLLSAGHCQAEESKWISLFDGKTLKGWKPLAKGDVTVKAGEIHMLSTKANLWLLHESYFTDFELVVEAKMPADGYNSGIGFRCIGPKKINGKVRTGLQGYQCEIDGAKSGMIYSIGTGWVWPKTAEQKKAFNQVSAGAFKKEGWNTFRIRCQGHHLQIWINGQAIADIQHKGLTVGRIALQHHGKGAVHRFRKVQIRELK